MIHLPPALAALYRTATAHEVHSWSFGRLAGRRRPAAESWEQQRGTLDDQGIFGPLRDFECACGKYRGKQYKAMICDRCGVKLTSTEERRRRFGHIDLTSSVPHPCEEGDLSAVPVLPAAFVCAEGGAKLAAVYDRLITLAAAEQPRHLVACLDELFGLLLPLVVIAHEWNLQDSTTLARGMALERRSAPSEDYCCECGYPLTGLNTAVCPGCGRQLRSR
jgi:hypothetical protein